jgi:hypothetical protein
MGYRYQIQFLDEIGRGGACLVFVDKDSPFRLVNLDLPRQVIEAAMHGLDDYVDAQGRRRLPTFLGGGLT